MRPHLPARLSSSRQMRIRMGIRRTHEAADWSPSPMPAKAPLLAALKTHLVPVAMMAKARTSPRSHASLRLPEGGKMKVPGQGATKRTCPLLRQEETTAEVGETIIRQGVAETVLTPRCQEEAETVRALRHLRLGGRRRALADKSPATPGSTGRAPSQQRQQAARSIRCTSSHE